MRYVVTSTEVVLPDEAKNLYKEQDTRIYLLNYMYTIWYQLTPITGTCTASSDDPRRH